MEKLKEYLKSIYGLDALSCGCVLLSVVINLITLLLLMSGIGRARVWSLLCYIPLLICIFRFFSTNRAKRVRENEWFIRKIEPFIRKRPDNDYSEGYQEKQKEDRRQFKFFKCPACRQKIRVPRGKGRIEITCPRCGDRFIKKT